MREFVCCMCDLCVYVCVCELLFVRSFARRGKIKRRGEKDRRETKRKRQKDKEGYGKHSIRTRTRKRTETHASKHVVSTVNNEK